MIKNYVLDTNILLQDEEAFLRFEDNRVFIPITVIDELDGLKNSHDSETAFNARCANRALERLFRLNRSRIPIKRDFLV